MESAALMGITIQDFWVMTPYELTVYSRAYAINMKDRREQVLTTAYLGAYWGRVKKMPNLKKLLGIEDEPVEKKPQTPEEMLKAIIQLNKDFGGETVV